MILGGTLGALQNGLQRPIEPPADPRRRGGFFGAGGPGRGIAGAIGDVLLQYAGMQPIYAQSMAANLRARMQQLQNEREDQQYQRQRTDRMADWRTQQEWQRNNPAPDQLERYMRAAGIDPASQQGRAMFEQAARNRANPMIAVDVQQPDGSTIRQFIRPGQQSPQGLTDEELDALERGGPQASNPAGGFRW